MSLRSKPSLRKLAVLATVGLLALPRSAIAADKIVIDFEHLKAPVVFDQTGQERGRFRGNASVSSEAHGGRGALKLGGGATGDCLDFGPNFGCTVEGTIEFWCKPKTLSGIVVGKQGTINLEFLKRQRCVRVGLILKSGWVSCESPRDSVTPDRWVHIHVSWGRLGLVLLLDRKPMGRISLPDKIEWRDKEFHFFVGTYNCPTRYEVWFFHGLVDDFSFRPEQVLPPGTRLPPRTAPRKRQPVLKLRLTQTPKPNYGTPVPAMVRGRIVLDANGNRVADPQEEGVPRVSVSDGYTVAKTGPDGSYALSPSKSAVFINITRPSGHDVSGFWYKPVAEKVHFTLKRSGQSEKDYTFVHVTDSHVSTARASLEGLSQFVTEVNALEPRPRFVVNSGDLVNLDKRLRASPATGHAYMRNYAGIMNHLKMPHYNVAGDHTDSSHRLEQFPRGDHRCGKPLFWEYLGPHFFSFEYGSVHFVSVDFGYHLGERKGYPTHKIIPEHVAWMKQDMAGRTPGTFVVTTAEHDLEKFCPGFLDMAKEHDVRLQLIGDDHIVHHKRQFVPYRVGGSLSGCWWNPRCRGLCPDLSPQGYMMYRVRGEEMECFYKGLGQRIAIVSHRYGAAWTGRVRLRARLVQPRPKETLRCSLNGRDWLAMREIARPFLRALYEAEVDSASLPDGLIEAKVKNPSSGDLVSRVFVVANGTPAPSFSRDASLTFTVGSAGRVKKAPSGKVAVLLNDGMVGVLLPNVRKGYTFPVPVRVVRKVNTLRFTFDKPGDGVAISSPILEVGGRPLEDPRCEAARKVRIAHWGEKAANWGGFVVGEGLCAGPFVREQSVFCFVWEMPRSL